MSAPKVGQRVTVNSSKSGGVVRFVGTTSFAPDVWVGVELDNPVGKNSGTVQDREYFQCPHLHGIFVRPDAVTLGTLSPKGQSKVQVNPQTLAQPGKGYPKLVAAAPVAPNSSTGAKYEHRDAEGNWSPFDDAANAVISAAHERGDVAVQLPAVMTPSPGTVKLHSFEIRFGEHACSEKQKKPSDTGICQVNLTNNNTRKVRRVEHQEPGAPAARSKVSKVAQKSITVKRAVPQVPAAPSEIAAPVPVAAPLQPPNETSPAISTVDKSVDMHPNQETAQLSTGLSRSAHGRQAPSPPRNDFGDEDPLPETAGPIEIAEQPEPEVSTNNSLSLCARVEYSALPRGLAQEVFGLVTVRAASPPEVPDSEGSVAAEAERQPMDIICVLDVSGSMQGNKIRQVQDAVRFIIEQARPSDRLGIVVFNSTASKVLRLRRMDADGKNDANVATLRLTANGGTSIAAGLSMAIAMMENRRQRNKVSALLLLTDGQDRRTQQQIPSLVARAAATHCSLISFGFGSDHDAALLSEIAEQARTPFTFVEDVEAVREAFAGAVGGLASVVAQNIELTLKARVPLTTVHTPFEIRRISDTQVTVVIPDIMAEERRDILVELAVPADPSAPSATVLLEASCVYSDLKSGSNMAAATVLMETERCDEPQPELEPDEEVSAQRERVEVTQALKQAAACSDQGQFEQAQQVIERSEQRVRSKKTKTSSAMCLELQDARSRMQSRSAWEHGGRAEVSDACQMHSMQRCAMESGSSKASVSKASKGMYISRAQKSMISKSKAAYGEL